MLDNITQWDIPVISEDMPHGDMPGDKIQIEQIHIQKANIIFPELIKHMKTLIKETGQKKIVITVCGGSGVGKSEIASLLCYYFQQAGIGSYTLSGDNYPHKIPKYNDAQRLSVFRESGIQGMVKSETLTAERFETIHKLQEMGNDADMENEKVYPWLQNYLQSGKAGLEEYLGSEKEIGFEELSSIIKQFKEGKEEIWLRRMGREDTELWYEKIDFSHTDILIVEWTHGNSDHYTGVDIPVFLNSTPQETLEHRKSRNRDGATDSPFVMLVLGIEQKMLEKQAHKAKIILSKSGKLLDYKNIFSLNNKPMLNAYPDSIGETLSDTIRFLKKKELANVFRSFYILPSIFHTDLDRGFSVIDYGLNQLLAKEQDLMELEKSSIELTLDFILNHASVLSGQFQDILKNGEESVYKDFFINWNTFWKDKGTMTAKGYIQPEEKYIKDMFFRKPGLPILMVRMPNGTNIPYWNTFYQKVMYEKTDEQDLMQNLNIQYDMAKELAEIINSGIEAQVIPEEMDFQKYTGMKSQIVEFLESKRKYLGQMDLNIKSPLVWDYYENILKQLHEYGAKIVRLDAFAYAPKEAGARNFLNDPGTWDLLKKIQKLADKYELTLLPEIHASYEEKIYEILASKGYMTYDFFLPGLILDALENADGSYLKIWADELIQKKIQVVNMLGCHDGIPLLDLKGLIPEKQIQSLIETVVNRGGYVKNLHGKTNIYYQVNATYYSALGEDDRKMLLARAIQIFMPGKPQVWYLDLFAGKNDYEAVKKAGADGHKEINRSNLRLKDVEAKLLEPVTIKQIEMLRFRNESKAFDFDADMKMETEHEKMKIVWEKDGNIALLEADLNSFTFEIKGTDEFQNEIFHMIE